MSAKVFRFGLDLQSKLGSNCSYAYKVFFFPFSLAFKMSVCIVVLDEYMNESKVLFMSSKIGHEISGLTEAKKERTLYYGVSHFQIQKRSASQQKQ